MGVQLDGAMSVEISRLDVIKEPSCRRRRTKAELARSAAQSMMPGVKVAVVARRRGTTRWQIHDWRKLLRKGNLVVPASVAALPIFAELVVDDRSTEVPAAVTRSDLEIVVGDVVIRADAGASEGGSDVTDARVVAVFCNSLTLPEVSTISAPAPADAKSFAARLLLRHDAGCSVRRV